MTHSRADITRLLEANGLSPRRAFGQNFVADPNTVRRIARLAAVGENDHVVEIGAGLGSLTLALAEYGPRITAIEIDHGVAPLLRDRSSTGRGKGHHQDKQRRHDSTDEIKALFHLTTPFQAVLIVPVAECAWEPKLQ